MEAADHAHEGRFGKVREALLSVSLDTSSGENATRVVGFKDPTPLYQQVSHDRDLIVVLRYLSAGVL